MGDQYTMEIVISGVIKSAPVDYSIIWCRIHPKKIGFGKKEHNVRNPRTKVQGLVCDGTQRKLWLD